MIELDEFEDLIIDDDRHDPAEWQVPWPGIPHLDQMDKYFIFTPEVMENIIVPNKRFATSAEAYAWFSKNYKIICYANNARYWAATVEKKK